MVKKPAPSWSFCIRKTEVVHVLLRASLMRLPGLVERLLFADDECLDVAGAVFVESARAAVARCGARHREGFSDPAPVEGRGAGHLDGGVPGAVGLADHERLEVAGAVCVVPARAAVARRGARHREDFSGPALVEARD